MDDYGNIVSTIARAAQFLDDGRVDDMESLFSADAALDVVGRVFHGWAEIRSYFDSHRRPLDDRGAHILSLPHVEIAADGRSARAATDFLVAGRSNMVPPGRYYDRFIRSGDAFQISERIITTSQAPPAPGWPSINR